MLRTEFPWGYIWISQKNMKVISLKGNRNKTLK